jgi:hypothetical protein
MLMRVSNRYRLDYWRGYGEWYQRALAAGLATSEENGERPSPVVAPPVPPPRGLLLDTMLTINPWVCGVDPSSSIATGWAAPEKLRVQAQYLLRDSPLDEGGRAENTLMRSLQVAQEQSALAWSLRSAISLGSLWRRKGQQVQASRVLHEMRGRFSEGATTGDLRRATTLLEELA